MEQEVVARLMVSIVILIVAFDFGMAYMKIDFRLHKWILKNLKIIFKSLVRRLWKGTIAFVKAFVRG